jgi:heme exporter protein C
LVQFLVYVGYLMLRASVEDPARKARFAAVYGVVAFVSVPINFIAIRLWRTQHPLMFGTEGGGLSPNMMFTFFFCLITFTLWYAALMWNRIRLENSRAELDDLKQQILS